MIQHCTVGYMHSISIPFYILYDNFRKVSSFKTIGMVTKSYTHDYLSILPIHSQTWPPLLLLFVEVQVPSADIQTYCIVPPESGTPAIELQFQLN